HHPGETGRREDQRQAGGLPENGGRGVHLRDVPQHPGSELDSGKSLPGAAQTALGLSRAVRVVKDGSWHPVSGQFPQVVDRGRGPNVRGGPPPFEGSRLQEFAQLGPSGRSAVGHTRIVETYPSAGRSGAAGQLMDEASRRVTSPTAVHPSGRRIESTPTG